MPAVGQDDTVIDLPGCTLLPGYMDAHVHVTGVNSRGPVPPAPDLAFRTLSSVQSALRHGVTTIRDVGSYYGIPVALKRAILRKHLLVLDSMLRETRGHDRRPCLRAGHGGRRC